MAAKKFIRSDGNKMIAGVIGGLGEYFEVDANLLRLLWALFTLFTGIFPGILIYVLAVIIVPRPGRPRSAKP